jgi:hypothetical protein
MARAYMEARLTRLYRSITDQEETPFDGVPNWSRYKLLFMFQKFVKDKVARMHHDHAELMRRYYWRGERVSGAENVSLVEVRKAFKQSLLSREVKWLKGGMRHVSP